MVIYLPLSRREKKEQNAPRASALGCIAIDSVLGTVSKDSPPDAWRSWSMNAMTSKPSSSEMSLFWGVKTALSMPRFTHSQFAPH